MGKQRGKGNMKDDFCVFDLTLQLAGAVICQDGERLGGPGCGQQMIMSYVLDILC